MSLVCCLWCVTISFFDWVGKTLDALDSNATKTINDVTGTPAKPVTHAEQKSKPQRAPHPRAPRPLALRAACRAHAHDLSLRLTRAVSL